MNKPNKFYRLITSRATVIFLLALVIWLTPSLRYYPQFVERWYSGSVYRAFSRLLHPVLNLIPFSIGDIFYALLITALLIALYRVIRYAVKKKWRLAGSLVLKVIIYFELLIVSFYLLWGLNYFRPSAAVRLGLTDTSYTTDDMIAVTGMLIDSANASRALLNSADLTKANSAVYQTSARAVADLAPVSSQFSSYSPKAKPSLFSGILNYMGTSGYYNPFTSEAQINYQMPIVDRPFTACHEMAHQMGYGREDEANFVGFLAGIRSADKLLKYSAYYLGVEEMMRSVRRRDSAAHKELRLKISNQVISDFKTDSIYWTQFEGKAWWLSGLFYDRYLKINNQPMGMRSYNRMIRLTMAYYRKRKIADKESGFKQQKSPE